MDEILESLAELVRSLSRLHNNNKGLLLNGDIDRLEKAKAILSKNATGDERWRVKPSNENGALPIPDVINSRLLELEKENKLLKLIIENGLGPEDLKNDCC